ncbi:hypothetical protein DEO72_LG5g2720 [Vigna unguiculata]|uniref:Uncharacterized protein n=1 Tax=Vigna unguiculata TaxID=3917 RepID=A0A4D6M0N3_VIGUN|nr:hypothetical protein DEO72_LG5g2720 [Vigna unguiculata]
MKHLAQASGYRLSENSWELVVVRLVVAQTRDLTFERRAVSLKRGGLLAVSPKRGPVA